MAIAASSFRPIRRASTSSLPAAVSNRHPSAALTIGTGNGQFSLPTTSVFCVGRRIHEMPLLPNATANTLRFIPRRRGIGRSTRSCPSGPNIASRSSRFPALDRVDERLDRVFRRGKGARLPAACAAMPAADTSSANRTIDSGHVC